MMRDYKDMTIDELYENREVLKSAINNNLAKMNKLSVDNQTLNIDLDAVERLIIQHERKEIESKFELHRDHVTLLVNKAFNDEYSEYELAKMLDWNVGDALTPDQELRLAELMNELPVAQQFINQRAEKELAE